MTKTQLFWFTARCLALNQHPQFAEHARKAFQNKQFPLESFIFLASNHLVLPALYLQFEKYNLLDRFPGEYQEHLKEIYRLNKNRNEQILKQIDEIAQKLDEKNIRPLFLKGTALLLDGIYSDIGERMVGDIDLLVQDTDYLKTPDLVLELNYINEFKLYSDPMQIKHYPRLFRKDVPADVEIHRIPVREKYTGRFSTVHLFQDKQKINNKHNCYVPSDEHKLIHTFIHGHLSNNGLRFKQIALRDVQDFLALKQRIEPLSVLKKVEAQKQFTEFVGSFNELTNPDTSPLIPGDFEPAHKFLKRMNYYLENHGKHKFLVKCLGLYNLLIKRYFLRIILAMFKKSSFVHIKNRITDPAWYRIHINDIRKYFS